jgi:hypothetical protein
MLRKKGSIFRKVPGPRRIRTTSDRKVKCSFVQLGQTTVFLGWGREWHLHFGFRLFEGMADREPVAILIDLFGRQVRDGQAVVVD